MIRSDGWWRFACGDVSEQDSFQIFHRLDSHKKRIYVNEERKFKIPAVKYLACEIFPLIDVCIQTEIRIHSSCKLLVGAGQMSPTEPEKLQIRLHFYIYSPQSGGVSDPIPSVNKNWPRHTKRIRNKIKTGRKSTRRCLRFTCRDWCGSLRILCNNLKEWDASASKICQ